MYTIIHLTDFLTVTFSLQ